MTKPRSAVLRFYNRARGFPQWVGFTVLIELPSPGSLKEDILSRQEVSVVVVVLLPRLLLLVYEQTLQ